jgi:DNA-binding LacI/PurR family transcriptional regulator
LKVQIVPKYQLIAEELKQEIKRKNFDANQALPSHNDLINRYGVSLGTVRQALNKLTSEGWIKAEPGRGVFANPILDDQPVLPRAKEATVGFAVFGQCDRADPVNMQFLHGAAAVVQESGKDLNYGVFSLEAAKEESFHRFLDRASYVLVCQGVGPEILEVLRARKMKTVIIGHMPRLDINYDDFHQVYCDLENAGYLAAQALALYGHRKIGYVYKLQKDTLNQAVMKGIDQACRQYGITNEGIFFVPNPEAGKEELDRICSRGEITGLIGFGDHGCISLIRGLEARRAKVPEDKSVVGIGSLPPELLVGWDRTLTRVNINFPLMGEEAARLLLSETKAAIHKMTPVYFEKGSTLQLNTALSEK